MKDIDEKIRKILFDRIDKSNESMLSAYGTCTTGNDEPLTLEKLNNTIKLLEQTMPKHVIVDRQLANLFDIPFVHGSDYIPKSKIQHKQPRSKKKRIQKKWRKNSDNYKEVEQAIIVDHNVFNKYMRPFNYSDIFLDKTFL